MSYTGLRSSGLRKSLQYHMMEQKRRVEREEGGSDDRRTHHKDY